MRSNKAKCSIVPSAITAVLVIAAPALKGGNVDVSGLQVSDPPGNVILITISTLRADHVSCLGYERNTTPNFDAFAGENVLFKNAFAVSGWMMPVHGSIFTALYPGLHGATHINKSLGDEHYTLAEILADNGYYCVGFCCNPRLDEDHRFAQGFDIYDDYSVSMIFRSLAFGHEKPFDINKQRTNALINDAAIRWLQNNTHKPFFMFIHYYDNHWDYLAPSPYCELYDPEYDGPVDGTAIAREPLFSNPPSEKDIQHIIALYDGEVKQTDNDLGEMLDYLKENGFLDNSIVIVLGDHGEQFYEHGHTSHHGVYEELIHIPLVVSIPGAPVKGKITDSLVSQVDILPTILDYLQIPAPDSCQGKSLKPIIEGRAETVNEFVFAEYTGGAVPACYALRSRRYKCCQIGDGEPFAYDLVKDPRERTKMLSHDFPEEVRVLQESLKKLMLK
jgi:arylsulfatase A-like enzyme